MPTIRDFSYVDNINPSNYDLVFKAEAVPSMGVHLYYVEVKNDTPENEQPNDEYATATSEYLGTNVCFKRSVTLCIDAF